MAKWNAKTNKLVNIFSNKKNENYIILDKDFFFITGKFVGQSSDHNITCGVTGVSNKSSS